MGDMAVLKHVQWPAKVILMPSVVDLVAIVSTLHYSSWKASLE